MPAKDILAQLIGESVTYRLPQSKNVLFYDFYVLSYLRSLNLDPTSKDSRASFFGGEVKEDVDHAVQVLVPYLRQNLLDATFLSICAEIRHSLTELPEWKQLARKMPMMFDYARNYLSKHAGMLRHTGEPYPVRGNSKSYDDSVVAALRTIRDRQSSKREFVFNCRKMFASGGWSADYGGRPWAGICDAWIRLHDTNPGDPSANFVSIDHLFDMQHNTGTVLNKVKEYAIDGGYSWLSRGLDNKAKVSSIRLLLPNCSSDMQRLAAKTLKTGGEPEIQKPKDWPKYFQYGATLFKAESATCKGFWYKDATSEWIPRLSPESLFDYAKRHNFRALTPKDVAVSFPCAIGYSKQYTGYDAKKAKYTSAEDEEERRDPPPRVHGHAHVTFLHDGKTYDLVYSHFCGGTLIRLPKELGGNWGTYYKGEIKDGKVIHRIGPVDFNSGHK